MTIRVLVAETDSHTRRLWSALLARENDVQIVGEAADGREALLAAQRLRPHAVLLDDVLANPGVIQALKAIEPPARVIVLGTYREGILTARAAGADDYVLKDGGSEEVIAAVRRPFGESPPLDVQRDDDQSGDAARRPWLR